MTTKKVGSAGRFGPRYGAKIRKAVATIEKSQKSRQECPVCRIGSMKRLSKGIYQCKKCNAKIAGKAYTLK
ncbi:MAG: 50S ribosomal protein L37ae [Nanoarchaeota archaeon]|nr:50S ribosomal protein L37ae [Nanoarchaeota archaeon]